MVGRTEVLRAGRQGKMISDETPLVLASASPRRADLLKRLGLPLVTVVPDADEALSPSESPEEYTGRVVAAKLESAAGKLHGRAFAAMLVADTVVVVEGSILGKPRDREDAERMLGRLVGRAHRVITRYAISLPDAPPTAVRNRAVSAVVTMRAATPRTLRGYVATGEGLDKAGAYAVQGIGAFLIETITGSPTAVIGLPLAEVTKDLSELGVLDRFA